MKTAKIKDFIVDEALQKESAEIGADDREGLKGSIKEYGLLEPISVIPAEEKGKLLIVDGFQRFSVITEIGKPKEIPYRVREELAGKSPDKIKEWIRINAGNRRHMNKYQKAVFYYKLAKEQGWDEKAKKRMKAGKKADPVAENAQGHERTRDRIIKAFGVSRAALDIYRRIERISDSIVDHLDLNHYLWHDIHGGLETQTLGFKEANILLDEIDSEKEEREPKQRGPKLFKFIPAFDLEMLAIAIQQAKDRHDIDPEKEYVPEFRLKSPTNGDYEKGVVYKGKDIGCPETAENDNDTPSCMPIRKQNGISKLPSIENRRGK